MAEVILPQLGETVTEGTITQFFKQVGDTVTADEALFEVSTDKVDTEVPSPVSGTLLEIRVAEGDTVDVGTVIAAGASVSGFVGPRCRPQRRPPPRPQPRARPSPARTSPSPEPAPAPEPNQPRRPEPAPAGTRRLPNTGGL